MAVLKSNFIKPNADEIANLDFDRLYIMVGDNAVKLSDIWVETAEGYKQLTDSRDVLELQNGNGYIYSDSQGGGAVDLTGSREHDDIVNYVNGNVRYAMNIVAPTSYETAEVVPLRMGNDLQPMRGMQRTVSTIEATDMSEQAVQDNYMLVQLGENSQFEYVKRSDIYHYEGETPVQSFASAGRVEDVARDGVQYFVNNQQITNLYVQREYELDKLLSYEKLDLESGERQFFETVEVDGSLQANQVHAEPIESQFSEQTPDADGKMRVRNFRLANNGEYINVRLKGRTVEDKVKLTDLYDSSEQPIVDAQGNLRQDLIDYIGEKLKIKLPDESFVETKTLTADQAQLRYDTVKTMQVTDSLQDVMAEDSYRKLEDGRYIQEKFAAQPTCYDFASDTEAFSAYLVRVGSGERERFVVISRAEFEARARGRDSFTLEGETVRTLNAQKLKRARFSSNCDVIQTTSRGVKLEECKVFQKIDEAGNEIDNSQELNAQREAFLDKYMRGQYLVEDIIDENGQVVSLDDKRYKLSDEYVRDNSADNSSDYEALKNKDISLVSKNGKVTAVKGGPKYDVGKAMAKKFTVWGQTLGLSFAGLCSVGGLLLAPALPVIMPVFVAGMVAAIPGIPIYCNIKGAIVNRAKSRFKDQVDIRRKQTAKDVDKSLETLYSATKEHMANKSNMAQADIDRAYHIFLGQMDGIENLIMELAQTKDMSTFTLEGGKCKYKPHNAHAVGVFQQELQGQIDELKVIDKKLKKAKQAKEEFEKEKAKIEAKRNQYGTLSQNNQKKLDKLIREKGGTVGEFERLQQEHDNLQTSIQTLSKDFTSEPTVHQADSKHQDMIARARTMKGFLTLKHFNDDNRFGLKEDAQQLLDSIEYDTKKGVFRNKETKYEFTFEQIQNEMLQRDAKENADSTRLKDVLFRLSSRIDELGNQRSNSNGALTTNGNGLDITQPIESIPSDSTSENEVEQEDTMQVQPAQIETGIPTPEIEREMILPKRKETESESLADVPIATGVPAPEIEITEIIKKDELNQPEDSKEPAEKQGEKLEEKQTEDNALFSRDLHALEERMHGQEDKVTKLRYLENGLKEIAKFQTELEEKLANASTDEEREKIQVVIQQVDTLANKCRELTELVQAQPDAVEPPVVEEQKGTSKGDKKSARTTATESKTRLSKPALEKLLKQIEKLGELDRLYYGADEEIPSDIEVQLLNLEAKIRPDVHLLKKASKNANYGIYLTRIIDAENVLKQYKHGKNQKIRISDGLEI